MDRAARWAGIAAMAITAALGAARALTQSGNHIVWTDRDLWRADRFLQDWPTAGAELSYGDGARVPGGAWYLFLAITRALGSTPEQIYKQLLGLDTLAALLLGALAWRLWGPVAGGVAALLYIGPADVRAALNAVWNPTGVPILLVCGHLCLAVALRTGRGAAWFGWGAFLGLAMQLHLTAAAWLAWSVAALLILERRAAVRGLAVACAGLLAVYAHHLVDEALRGWPNTTAMARQTPVSKAAEGQLVELDWTELGSAFLVFRPDQPGPLDLPLSLVMAWLAALGAVGCWQQGGDRLLRALAIPALGVTLMPGLSPGIIFEDRYVLSAWPAWVLLAAWGATTLGRPGLVALAATAVAPLVDLRSALDQLRSEGDPSDHKGAWPAAKLEASVRALIDEAHPTLASVAGRTAFLGTSPRGLGVVSARSAEIYLQAAGEHFPGSLPPPCFVVTEGPPPPDEELAAALDLPSITRLDVRPVPWGRVSDLHTVTYLPGAGRLCRTSMYNRYIDPPVEAELRILRATLPAGASRQLEGPDGATRLVGRGQLERMGFEKLDWSALVDLRVVDGQVQGVVYVPQLGGHSFNTGWYQNGMAQDLRLSFRGEGGPVEVGLSDLPVGPTGIVSPFRFEVRLPAGRYNVELVGRPWWSSDTSADWHDWQAGPEDLRIPLSSGLEVAAPL